MFGYPVLRSKPQRWIPELRFGYPPLRNFPKSFWEKLGIFLESLGGSQRKLWIKTRPLRCSNMGSQHPSPTLKALWNFELQVFWPEMITSHDAGSTCLKGQGRHMMWSFWAFFGHILAGKDHITWWMLPADNTPCRTAFPVISQTIATTPPLLSVKSGLSQSKDRPNKGASQKILASEAYYAMGGVARNSIADRAIVGH